MRARTRREEVEPIAALQHAHHRRRSDALTQQRGPARHVLGLEREAAERVAVERVEPGGYQQQVGRPPLQGGVHRSEEIARVRSEEHTSELQSRLHLVCRLLLEKKKKKNKTENSKQIRSANTPHTES